MRIEDEKSSKSSCKSSSPHNCLSMIDMTIFFYNIIHIYIYNIYKAILALYYPPSFLFNRQGCKSMWHVFEGLKWFLSLNSSHDRVAHGREHALDSPMPNVFWRRTESMRKPYLQTNLQQFAEQRSVDGIPWPIKGSYPLVVQLCSPVSLHWQATDII